MGNKGRGKQKGEGGRERGLVTETAVLTTSSMSSIDIFSVIQYSVKRRSVFSSSCWLWWYSSIYSYVSSCLRRPLTQETLIRSTCYLLQITQTATGQKKQRQNFLWEICVHNTRKSTYRVTFRWNTIQIVSWFW